MKADRTAEPRATHRKDLPVVAILAAGALAATLAACSPQARVVGGGSGPALREPVKLQPGSVKADLQVVGNATQILKESASDSLEAAGMTCPGTGAACSGIDLSARLVAPASGFAAASPPVRIVELIAAYRGAGAERATSTVSYQRTVAAAGNLSTATWMRVSDALMSDLAADFSFRSRKSGIVIRLPSWASGETGLGRASTPRAFHVAITGDGRDDEDSIGNVGGREVRLARRATDYITEMLTDDLRGAGHTIVPARDGRLVGSQLEKFWIASVEGSGGWKTTAEIEMALEVAPPPGVKRKKAERHRCSAADESRQLPGEPDLARLLQKCMVDLARSLRNDAAWSLGEGAAAAPKS
ncbi:MAG: hypothetical protein ABR538_09335 [Candidatus Binatia bacterium]